MCDSGKHWATHEGLATLDPLAVRLKDLLDASFLNIAASLSRAHAIPAAAEGGRR